MAWATILIEGVHIRSTIAEIDFFTARSVSLHSRHFIRSSHRHNIVAVDSEFVDFEGKNYQLV